MAGAIPILLEAVKRLMSPPPAANPGPVIGHFHAPPGAIRDHRTSHVLILAMAVIAAAVAYLVVDKVWLADRTESPPAVTVPAPATPAPPMAAATENSIAVLPFADMSEKKDEEYFSDGLSEELIDRLAKIPDLAVSARTSSFYFKGKQNTIAEIARILGVAHVLEGSVRKSGSRLRVTVQLIRADNGYHLWSETYDRKTDDIFKIQDEISTLVTKALKLALLPAALPASETKNVEANDLYLRASFIYRFFTNDSTARTVTLLRHALSLDPQFARAWALLARARSYQAWQPEESSLAEAAEALKEAREAAGRAIALAPTGADGHVALGRIYLLVDKDFEKARAEIDRAIALEPRNADALLQRANIASDEDRLDEAVRIGQQALALNPLDPNIMIVLANNCLATGDGVTAERLARKVGELYPDNKFWKGSRIGALALLGRAKEAYELAETDVKDEFDHLWNQAYFYPALGRGPEADAALMRLEAADPAKVPPFLIAQVYAHRGNKDRTFEWLDRQYNLDPRALSTMNLDFNYIAMRTDPRYQELRGKMKLPALQLPTQALH